MAHKHGYRISKSRQREHLNNRGQFMLIDNSKNAVVMGSDYDASLTDIHHWLTGECAE